MVLYWCETWPFTYSEEFSAEDDNEETGEWKKLYND
jgi:hypothetical protein